jgi:phosphonate transport system permease protein
VIRYGYLPQVLPVFISQSLYFWESNTRSATILGIVGAGGIGMILIERFRARFTIRWPSWC